MDGVLQKILGVPDLVGAGVSSIIGAGIFVIISIILRYSGPLAPLAVLLAAIPNITAGFSYAEIASKFQNNTSEYHIINEIFGSKTSTISSILLTIFMIFNNTTILLSGVDLIGIPEPFKIFSCIGITVISSVINYLGINISKTVMNVMSFIIILVLIFIIIVGSGELRLPDMDDLAKTNITSSSFLYAAFLSLFLFTGYDGIVKLTEETKDPVKTIPSGINLTMGIVTVIYFMLTWVFGSMNWRNIARSVSPISEVVGQLFGNTYVKYMLGFSLLIVFNAFFSASLSLSRWTYGLSEEGILPSIFSEVNKEFSTPHYAIIGSAILSILSFFIGDGEKSAVVSNFFYLIFLAIMMAAVIIMRQKEKDPPAVDIDERQKGYRMPGYYGKIPIPAVIGVVSCLGFAGFLLYRTMSPRV